MGENYNASKYLNTEEQNIEIRNKMSRKHRNNALRTELLQSFLQFFLFYV